MRAVLFAAVLSTFAGARAEAQCVSNASSCRTCHEVQGTRPIAATPWHVDHGFADLCAACHRGDPEVLDRAAAHVDRMPDPLTDPGASCASCHPKDSIARAARYLSAGSPPTTPPPVAPAPPPGRAVDRVLFAVAVLLAVLLGVLVPRRRPDLASLLRAPRFSAVGAGVGLGLVVALSELLLGRPVAVAGAFDRLAAYLGRALFPGSTYHQHVMRPAITWQVWLVVGLLLGAFVASRLAGQARWRWLPDTQWEPRFGPSRARRLVVAFVGAILVQVGAGIAGGCTSGLAISGGVAMAPAAFLFVAGMFAAGIPTAWLWYRKGPT